MKPLDLSSFIEDTQKKQQSQLEEFEQYINISTELKNHVSQQDESQQHVIAQVINSFSKGMRSSAVINEDKHLASLWSILLKNEYYIEKLNAIALPESGAADKRLDALITYMESQLSAVQEVKSL